MSTQSFNIQTATTRDVAKEQLFKEAKKHCSLVDEQVEICMTTIGIALRLYNKDKRPTVYSVEIKIDKYGFASTLLLDTIILEMRDTHECIKTSFSVGQATHIINLLVRLSAQSCNGNKTDTLSVYKPMGLLYWKDPNPTPAELLK